MHKLDWYLARVGKRIFRDETTCHCQHCTDVLNNGVVIRDREHAYYIHMAGGELGINYRDKK